MNTSNAPRVDNSHDTRCHGHYTPFIVKICVKILRRDFEEVRAIFRDQRLDHGAHVGLEEECSNLMILFHWEKARINRKQQ